MLVKFSVGMLLFYSRNKTLFSDLNAHLALDRDDHFTVLNLRGQSSLYVYSIQTKIYRAQMSLYKI